MFGGQSTNLQVCLGVARSLGSALSLAVLSWACAGPSSVDDIPPQLIAHSGGIGNHRTYTNSLEALDNSVARGHTAIEVDLSWTSDQQLVLLHDWDHEFEKLFDRSPGRLSLAEFQSLPSPNGLTHLDLHGLAGWLTDNPGVEVITDIKERVVDGLRLIAEEYPEHRHRILPQIYHPESYLEVKELGYGRVILTLYRTDLTDQQVIDFATEHPLFGVTMPARRATKGTLPAELAVNGVRVFAHTVNDYLTLEMLQSKGVYGVYTDWLTPNDELFSRPLDEWWVLTEGEVPLENLVVPFLPWEMAGLETVVDCRNDGESEESIHLHIMDSGGRPIATRELEIPGNDVKQLDFKEFAAQGGGHGWLLIETADEIVVRPRWRFLGSSEGVWVLEEVSKTRFETGGSGSGLGGLLVAIVNPTDATQSYRLQRFISADAVDDDVVDLEPGHQLLRIYRSQTDEETRLTVTGGPMVAQVLRWDPMGRFMR